MLVDWLLALIEKKYLPSAELGAFIKAVIDFFSPDSIARKLEFNVIQSFASPSILKLYVSSNCPRFSN